MSTSTPPLPHHRNHRHTRSAALPPPTAVSQNPLNPHHLNLYAHSTNFQTGMDQQPQPTTPPRTPRKSDNSNTNNGPQTSGTESASKPRSRGKGRPKSMTTTPAGSRNDRSTPPLTGMQPDNISTSTKPISTPSTAAYAGPTFHASPAPSALPIPSFYSKSVPDSPGMKGPQMKKEETSSVSNDSPTPPAARAPAAQPQREESPLDFIFKADREERARARSASSFHGAGSESGPFTAPSETSQQSLNTASPGNQGRNRNAHFSGGSTSALFAMELDGTNSPGKPIGPAFSTPYHERINAARSSAASQQKISQATQEQQFSRDRSEALKAYLFSSQTPVSSMSQSAGPPDARFPSPAQSMIDNVSRNPNIAYSGQGSTTLPPRQHHNNYSYFNDSIASRHSPRGGSRTSGLRQEVTPTNTPMQTPERTGVSSPTPLSPSRGTVQDSPSVSGNSQTNLESIPVSLDLPESPSRSASGGRNPEFKVIEDSLRRILKLDPVENSSVSGTGIGAMPAASMSVPNYVGGRPPPMNGLHNGVMGS